MGEGLWRTFREATGFYGVIAGSMCLGLALGFVGLNRIRALYFSAIMSGLAAPPLILVMLLLANSKAVMGIARAAGSLDLHPVHLLPNLSPQVCEAADGLSMKAR